MGDFVDIYKLNSVLRDKLKILRPILYDEPNDLRLVSLSICIGAYTVIDLNGVVLGLGGHMCENISIYHHSKKSIREPTDEEIRRKWYNDGDGKTPVFIDWSIYDDYNEIFEIDVEKYEKLDNAMDIIVDMIKNEFIKIGYDLSNTD